MSQASDLGNWINDKVLLTAAIVGGAISLADLFFGLDALPFLEGRQDTITLFFVSALLLSLWLERRLQLNALKDALTEVIRSTTFGVQFLPDAKSVTRELERAARQADEQILAIGAKSRAVKYLSEIADAVE